ncbi:MAG: DUF429 domain-containing protein [Gammaproteobacteria bacterium]|nr:DUF429 domain-containing protein [Gammaproteobacteria bacterium]MCY4277098.1 DUF429 domain-containing protein [Gammaproteobacteria bacterium]MCY4323119.1 DUF429 domain-containing protein [Gammaproteobacteria bacterium]
MTRESRYGEFVDENLSATESILTSVIAVDPAPAKKSTIFDGQRYHQKSCPDLRAYIEELARRSPDTLLCWDAPLTGPADPTNAGSSRYDYTQRRIEQFFSRKSHGFKAPPGISVRGYSGLPHWTITRSILGLPRTGPYDQDFKTLPFRLLPDQADSSSDLRPTVVEIHPAIAAWLWCKNHRNVEMPWTYKKDSAIREELWKIIREIPQVPRVARYSPKDDDEFDAAVGYILGYLYLRDRQKPIRERRVIQLGDRSTGAFLVPSSSLLIERWNAFANSSYG